MRIVVALIVFPRNNGVFVGVARLEHDPEIYSIHSHIISHSDVGIVEVSGCMVKAVVVSNADAASPHSRLIETPHQGVARGVRGVAMRGRCSPGSYGCAATTLRMSGVFVSRVAVLACFQ